MVLEILKMTSLFITKPTQKIVAENLDNSEKWIIWIIQNLDNYFVHRWEDIWHVFSYSKLCENISILIYFHTWNKLNLSIMFSNLCLNLMHCEHLNYIFSSHRHDCRTPSYTRMDHIACLTSSHRWMISWFPVNN